MWTWQVIPVLFPAIRSQKWSGSVFRKRLGAYARNAYGRVYCSHDMAKWLGLSRKMSHLLSSEKLPLEIRGASAAPAAYRQCHCTRHVTQFGDGSLVSVSRTHDCKLPVWWYFERCPQDNHRRTDIVNWLEMDKCQTPLHGHRLRTCCATHRRTSSQQFYNLLYNMYIFTTNGQKFATSQHLDMSRCWALALRYGKFVV